MIKMCTRCKQEKQIEEFYTATTGRPKPECKSCTKGYVKRWYQINGYKPSENRRIYAEKWRLKYPDYHRNWRRDCLGKAKNIKLRRGGYISTHEWLYHHYGNADKCENTICIYPRMGTKYWMEKPKRYEWALLKGKEHSHNRENYIMLCVSCHRAYDSGKITQIFVSEVKEMYGTGKYTQQYVAEKFGITQPKVSSIINDEYQAVSNIKLS